MKLSSVVFLIVLPVCTLYSFLIQPDHPDIIGKWDSVDSQPPKMIRIEFKTDNEFVYTNMLIADYKYKLEGNLLICSLEKKYPVKKILIDTSYLQIKKDTIIRSYNRLGWKDTVLMIKDMSYKVDGGQDSNPLTGKWKWAYPMGDTATAIFRNNGMWHFSYPQDIYKGTYKINKDTLSIKMNNGGKAQIKTYKVEGKLLELKDLESGNQSLYRRAVE